MKTFEKFLENICFTLNPSVLDDDMSDFFDAWLGGLDGEQFIKYGQLYGEDCAFWGAEAVKANIKEDID